MISKRGTQFSVEPLFMKIYGEKVFSNPFDPEKNFSGCINLGSAETRFPADMLEEQFMKLRMKNPSFPDSYGYSNFAGIKNLQIELANLFSNFIAKTPSHHCVKGPESRVKFLENSFVVTNGAGTAIETLCSSLCDDGEYVIIPSPMYHGFANDIEKRFSVKVLPFPLTRHKDASYSIDFDALEDLYNKYPKNKIRAFMHCNPHNPTGLIFSSQTTERLIHWCIEKKVHLISDEIYAQSTFNMKESNPFVSTWRICQDIENKVASTNANDLKLALIKSEYRNYVHLVYSFSKDFGLNGFRVGLVYTENKDLLKALNACSYFTSASTDVQYLLYGMLSDHQFVEKLFTINQARANNMYKKVLPILQKHNISVLDPEGGTFIWVNILGALKLDSTKLLDPSWIKQKEMEIWYKCFDEGVCILPSLLFQEQPNGWFRICFTPLEEKYVIEGVNRIIRALFPLSPSL